MAETSHTVISRVVWCVTALRVPPQNDVAQDAATSPGVRGSSLRCLEVRLAAAEDTWNGTRCTGTGIFTAWGKLALKWQVVTGAQKFDILDGRTFDLSALPALSIVHLITVQCLFKFGRLLKATSYDHVKQYYLLTYSMVQSPSWEANWFAASQEIPRILWNP